VRRNEMMKARMLFYYDKQYRNDPQSIIKQLELRLKRCLKKPLRPAKNAILKMLNIPIWEAPKKSCFPTHYQPKSRRRTTPLPK
jgi:hypothetical protein